MADDKDKDTKKVDPEAAKGELTEEAIAERDAHRGYSERVNGFGVREFFDPAAPGFTTDDERVMRDRVEQLRLAASNYSVG